MDRSQHFTIFFLLPSCSGLPKGGIEGVKPQTILFVDGERALGHESRAHPSKMCDLKSGWWGTFGRCLPRQRHQSWEPKVGMCSVLWKSRGKEESQLSQSHFVHLSCRLPVEQTTIGRNKIFSQRWAKHRASGGWARLCGCSAFHPNELKWNNCSWQTRENKGLCEVGYDLALI